ncbi:helix-turn-helix domain-containing protein [Kocuria sp. M4R2S49]|uniref:helix-turn-helix domain-containing protein n=1 Tax=Kocuria rhizosphaericola TaxID=3376284 RepID=UPI0037AA7B81
MEKQTRASDAAPKEASSPQLGQRLRTVRTAKGISLRELARLVGVSASFMSQIELGRATPSVGTLFAVARELNISVDELMSEGSAVLSTTSSPVSPPSVEADAVGALAVPHSNGNGPSEEVNPLPEVGQLPGLQRADQRPQIFLNGVRWERLTLTEDPEIEFLRVTYPPDTESCPVDNLMHHGGKEYFHVLSGRLEVQVAFSRQVLNPGDSISFDSSIPHRLSNPFSDEECVAIWVIHGRFH